MWVFVTRGSGRMEQCGMGNVVLITFIKKPSNSSPPLAVFILMKSLFVKSDEGLASAFSPPSSPSLLRVTLQSNILSAMRGGHFNTQTP